MGFILEWLFVSIDFNESYVTSVIAVLTLTLGVNGSLIIMRETFTQKNRFHCWSVRSKPGKIFLVVIAMLKLLEETGNHVCM